jgi:hypothetical protein
VGERMLMLVLTCRDPSLGCMAALRRTVGVGCVSVYVSGSVVVVGVGGEEAAAVRVMVVAKNDVVGVFARERLGVRQEEYMPMMLKYEAVVCWTAETTLRIASAREAADKRARRTHPTRAARVRGVEALLHPPYRLRYAADLLPMVR